MCFKLCSRAPRIEMTAGASGSATRCVASLTPRASRALPCCAASLSARPVCEQAIAHDVLGGAGGDHLAARIAALGPQVDDPVGRAHDVEVVLDHQERVPGLDEAAERAQQLCDIVEVQTGGRLVEQEQRAARGGLLPGRRALHGVLRQMARELQPLRLAAGERRHRLTQAQIVESDFCERREAQANLRIGVKYLQRLRDREVEDIGDAQGREALAAQLALENLRPIAPAVAVRTAQIHVRQKLHLDVLEAVAAAAGATAVAGVEAEGARRVLALARLR